MKATVYSSSKRLEFSGKDLIHQLQLRNDEAFTYLYDAYSPALLHSIRKAVKCPFTGEDILQEVFLKIWLHINTYSIEKGGLFNWMLSIARHETIDYLRSKQAKRSGLTSSIHENKTEVVTIVQPELTRFDVLRSLALIPYKERVIIELYNIGFTCREIGGALCLPEGSVKTKMRTTYRKLRAMHA